MTDRLTVLRCEPGHRAAKLIRGDGAGSPVVEGYDAGAWFEVREPEVADLGSLAATLEAVAADPRAFVIRGEPLPGVDRHRCRRLLHEQEDGVPPTFRDVPRRWLLLDFDGLTPPASVDPLDGELAGVWLRSRLPAEFHGSSFWWSLTAGAGLKPGLRMRLAFWLDRAVGEVELKRWLRDVPVDHAVFRAVQPIYVARPLFVGLADPVRVRSGVEWDVRDAVTVPELAPDPPPARPTIPARRWWGGPRPASYALLEDAAAKVARTTEAGANPWGGAGRHHALFCATLRSSRLIAEGSVPRADVEAVLAAAALHAGLRDRHEIERTIRNGFRQGGVSC